MSQNVSGEESKVLPSTARSGSPLKPSSAASSSPNGADLPPFPEAALSPIKAPRPTKRQRRQISLRLADSIPPLAPPNASIRSAAVHILSPSPLHVNAPTPLLADVSLAPLSRSAPTARSPVPERQPSSGAGRLDSHQRPSASSSSDEWDMPTVANDGKQKQSMTWQQETLRSTPGGGQRQRVESVPTRSSGGANKEARKQQSKSSKAQRRPPLGGSVSDSAAGLTWQQELLQQSDSAPTPNRYSSSSSPSKNASTNRHQQERDEQTFGMGGLEIGDKGQFAMDDLFSPPPPSPNHNHAYNQHQNNVSQNQSGGNTNGGNNKSGGGRQQQQSKAPSTPTRAVEARYAGPTFHNSPAPSSLPTPSFLLRRQATSAAV